MLTSRITTLAKPTQGLSCHNTHQLYQSITIPKMLYAADIWYTPIHHINSRECPSGLVGFMSKLAKVQHTAALYITGALQSTANNLLDTHADLTPIRFALNNHSHNSMLQLLTLLPSHPLYHIVRGQLTVSLISVQFRSPLNH